jgi:hypothetical protein
VLLGTNFWGNEIKNETSTLETQEKHVRFWLQNPKGKDNLKVSAIDRIILK